MGDQSPFSSFLKMSATQKRPNFGLDSQNFVSNSTEARSPSETKMEVEKVDSKTSLSKQTKYQEQKPNIGTSNNNAKSRKPISFGTLPSLSNETGQPGKSPFSTLIKKQKDTNASFGSSAMEQLTAKYLNTNQMVTPNFGSNSSQPAIGLETVKTLSSGENVPTKSEPIRCERKEAVPADNSLEPHVKSPLCSLINKHRDANPLLGSSTIDQLASKYLNSNFQTSPKFGFAASVSPFGSTPGTPSSVSSNEMNASKTSDILCPNFGRKGSNSLDCSLGIRPLRKNNVSDELPSPLKERKNSNTDLICSSPSGSEIGSPSSKLTFSPLPGKSQSPRQTSLCSNPYDCTRTTSSSLSKLKDRFAKQSKECPKIFDSISTLSRSPTLSSRSQSGSPRTSSTDENESCPFNFDLTNALITPTRAEMRKSPRREKANTPKRRAEEHRIVVDQLDCVIDARTLLEAPRGLGSHSKRKHLSHMGKVICKKWKEVSPDIVFPVDSGFRIPVFKFDTMSPDDEIQAKFKRRR